MSVVVWIMMGMALWHFAVLVPDRFWGGIIGAFGAAVAGALASGFPSARAGAPDFEPAGDRRGAAGDPRLAARAGHELRVRGPRRQGAGDRAALMGVFTHGRRRWRRPPLTP
jgi:hypothetical protein